MTTMLDDLKSVSAAARRPLGKLAYERLTRIFAQNQLIDLATNQVQRSPVVIFNRVAESAYTPYGIFVAPQLGDMRFVRHPDLVGQIKVDAPEQLLVRPSGLCPLEMPASELRKTFRLTRKDVEWVRMSSPEARRYDTKALQVAAAQAGHMDMEDLLLAAINARQNGLPRTAAYYKYMQTCQRVLMVHGPQG